jgi:DNA-binding NtrC family response regulator
MSRAGYRVRIAADSRQVIRHVYQEDGPALLILDPDLPDAESSSLLKKLRNRIPRLPVIIHTFFPDYDARVSFAAAFVEKQGNSVEHLTRAVSDILKTQKETTHGNE